MKKVINLEIKIMKNLLVIVGLALSYTANAQWVTRTVNNDFDDPYRIAYTKDNDMLLKLENVDGEVWVYVANGYTCDDELTVDASFIVNGVAKKYTFNAFTSTNRENVFFIVDLINENCLIDFKACTSVKIRVNDTTCNDEIYQFNMSGSTAAVKFIFNQ
jgi:hypothetical protein